MTDDVPVASSVAFSWCSSCKSVHVGLFDGDHELICMANLEDLDQLISMLQQAKNKETWMLESRDTQRLQ